MMKKVSLKRAKGGDGNTEVIPSYQAKIWTFTLNNWVDSDKRAIVSYFDKIKAKYVIGEELGKECKTPHLQGHVEFFKKLRLTALKKLNPKIHWEKCRNKIASRKYCCKDDKYITNIRMPRPIVFPVFNRAWQIEIEALIKTPQDDRKIYWFWEPDGNVGKTTFTKHLVVNRNAIIVPTKKTDAFHAIAKKIEVDEPIDLVIYDIPRSAIDFINYGAIEKVKDGLFVSGKYEGAECVYASPHLICFANCKPELGQMSRDRWIVKRLQR